MNTPLSQTVQWDREYVWHPFTQMTDWIKSDPIVITRGKGSWLWDANARRYLDANSSIWTNLHGHNHPKINHAIERQLRQISHCSALGLANKPASELAARLAMAARPSFNQPSRNAPFPALGKVFFSDDGSTAMEAALKMAYVYARRSQRSKKPRFLSLDSAYHGDTVGAASVGHINLFHETFRGLLFPAGKVMSPACYRCPFNRASPEPADARTYRKCEWECVDAVNSAFRKARKERAPYTAMVVEPVLQGAAGMVAHPEGWLKRVAEICRWNDALLIADEVLTGLGRASDPVRVLGDRTQLLACHQEEVQPDLVALAKGLTGGYLPMAATLASTPVFEAFLGRYDEFKTFFHGHSYSGNPLGASAALANLRLLESKECLESRQALAATLRAFAQELWKHPQVGDVRQSGMVLAVELVRNRKTREPWPLANQAGIRVCSEMAKLGVLTRPIGNVIVLMPPYCTTPKQVDLMFSTLGQSIRRVFN